MSLITLTTDFGLADHYVAAMKGVILSIAPQARIVDVTHEIRPQDVVQGAFVFRQAFPYFPKDTIHVVVVDPGVGSARRLLAARYAGQTVLAPDNGLLSLVHHDFPIEALREISNERQFVTQPSATFHGRDIIAPAAGHLAAGEPFDALGPITDRLEILNLSDASLLPDGTLQGCIVHVDRYGNLTTNIRRSDVDHGHGAARHVWVNGQDVGPVRRTYTDVAEGEPLALIGSADLLEIAVNSGNAASRLRATPGQSVVIK